MNEAKYREAEERLWDSAGRKPIEHFVELPRNGVRVRVQEVGEGPPALFLHGGPNSGSTWAPLLEHLEGFRCLLLDRPGTGLSDPIKLRKDAYFVLGDNSPASSDARAWYNHHFVEEANLAGKALFVYWPHTWWRPIPFFPNFKRMGFIR